MCWYDIITGVTKVYVDCRGGLMFISDNNFTRILTRLKVTSHRFDHFCKIFIKMDSIIFMSSGYTIKFISNNIDIY